MSVKQHNLTVILVIPAWAFGEFMMDLRAPSGISSRIQYFIPMLLTISLWLMAALRCQRHRATNGGADAVRQRGYS
jgi:hypothetical protein